jgi:hypothetical protein
MAMMISPFLLEHAGFVLELVDQFGDRLDLDAGLAARRLLGLQDLERRGVVSTPKSAGSSCRAASSWPS